MSNELTTTPQNDIGQMQIMAKLFSESGMFTDMGTMAKAFIKIQAGKELGIEPFAAMSGIHIIKGKATIGAGLMAGKIKSSGKYDYKIVEHTEKICKLEFFQEFKSVGFETFTIEDAKKAGTQNLDKYPKNMLFARAISNGMKFFCPDLYTMPVYTPEEMFNVTEDVQHTEVVADIRPLKIKVIEAEPFNLTPESQAELVSLIKSSTLDTKSADAAAGVIAGAKDQATIDKVKARLLQVQTPSI